MLHVEYFNSIYERNEHKTKRLYVHCTQNRAEIFILIFSGALKERGKLATATSLGHVVGPPSPPQSPPLSPPLSATRGNGGEGKRQRRLRHCLRQQESNDDMECTRTQKREGRKACREERIRSGEAGGGGGGLLLPSSVALGLPPLPSSSLVVVGGLAGLCCRRGREGRGKEA